MAIERLTKRQKRIARQTSGAARQASFNIEPVEPLTVNQQKTFDAFAAGKHLMLHGTAGTGKTFLSMYLAIDDIVSGESDQNKIIIIRSVVPTRDMGFLPGNTKEKTRVYESPYYAICAELFGRGDAYELLKTKGMIEFMSTSYIRGITLSDCYIIIDECQNMSFQELNSIITRAGEQARFIFCGDIRQDDLTSERHKEYTGITDFMRITNRMSMFESVEFGTDDIVRSTLVKEYIIQRDALRL